MYRVIKKKTNQKVIKKKINQSFVLSKRFSYLDRTVVLLVAYLLKNLLLID
jgi:hypothetical protein